MNLRSRWIWCALLAAALPASAQAGTYTYTVQSTAASSDDSYLKEDNDDERNGDKPDLRLKATDDLHNKHAIVRMPLPALANRTVVQAWLKLTVSAGGSEIPLETRVYPLLQTWTEADVSWGNRTASALWTTPGGTHGPRWTGRTTVSELEIGQQAVWGVGPILNAWQRGTLANHGLLLDADRGTPDREIVFRSSEYTSDPSATPVLVIHATDEPPAIVEGSAEIQPRAIRAGTLDAPLDVWVDAAASGTTPSGAATGFDTAILTHSGKLVGLGLDGVWVNGVAQPAGQVSWYDNGTSVTVQFPRATGTARVRVALRVRMLSTATSGTLELPVLVDDSATPGAWAQALWAGDADGTAGNGDDWLVAITNQPPVSIDLRPDTATVISPQTVPLQTLGRDGSGNTFAIVPDTLIVVPAAGGTATASSFRAGAAGVVRVIAKSGALRDTSTFNVIPPRLPVLSAIELRDRAGALTGTLTPQDSMRLDVRLSDGDGFRDITGMDFAFSLAGHENDHHQPAFRAGYRWRRSSGWSFDDPVGSSWSLVAPLCQADTATATTAPVTVRLGFVPGRIARASGSGWSAVVRVYSSTPPDTTTFTLGSLALAARTAFSVAGGSGEFSSGRPGALHLPLREPVEGAFEIDVLSNTNWTLDAAVTHLAGDSSATDTLFVSPPPRVAWAPSASGTGGGWLDTTLAPIGTAGNPAVSEQPETRAVYLWLDHPGLIPAQTYRGAFRVRAGGGSPVAVPLAAMVVDAGQAAASATGEVTPHTVQAGTAGASFTADLFPSFQAGDSGIDRMLVNLPAGYGTPALTGVTVAGLPVSATDLSAPGLLRVALASRVSSPSLVHVTFAVTVPASLDSAGSSFSIQFDDSSTPLAAQSANPGDANGVADGDDWQVRVVAGPVAHLAITPDPASCLLGSSLSFSAAATDDYGYPTSGTIAWSVLDPVGTIHPQTGLFTGTAAGTGRVVAQSGGVQDTVLVSVRPLRGLAIRAVEAPPRVYQGQPGVSFRVEIENIGALDAAIDSLVLRFRRGSADADSDFAMTAPGLPVVVASGTSSWLDLTVRVADHAATGGVTADARASALASGQRVSADGAGVPASFEVSLGGVNATAAQFPGPIRPREEGVLLRLDLTNRGPFARRLQALTLAHTTGGPGDPDQRDAELGEVRLYLDDGNGTFEPGPDPVLVETVALGGEVRLAPLSAAIAPDANARLFVTVQPALEAHDGDVLDLALAGAAALEFDSTTVFANAWPVAPTGGLTVDGMVAAQVELRPAGTGVMTPGAVRQPALSVVLPPNGFATDVLQRLGVENLGSVDPENDVTRVQAWVDDGDGTFDSGDRLIGSLAWTGARWQRTGLSEAVPLAGLPLHFTVDLAASTPEGLTVQLALPTGSDPGVGMASGNSGPLDRAIPGAPSVVAAGDRLAIAAAPLLAPSVAPGARRVPLLHLQASNGYTSPRTVTALALVNDTRGTGTVLQRDREIDRLRLHLDADGDGVLGSDVTDPVVGVATFTGGRASFEGFSWTVGAGTTASLFVTGDVSVTAAADGDSLGVALAAASDLSTVEPSAILAAWPVTGTRTAVDGMTAAQIVLQPVPGPTLAPGDGPVRALDLIVPGNGYRTDVLSGVRVVNLGSAVASDVDLHLWRDGGDGTFDAGAGDDTNLGAMVFVAGGWQSPLLTEPLPALGAHLFVSVAVGASPADSATVQLATPVFGITVESGNDGPRDAAVANPQAIVLSTAPLLASLSTRPLLSTVGQQVQLEMVVRNDGAELLAGIRPSAPLAEGSAGLTLLAVQPDSFDLAPGAVDTFTWTYRADAPGDVRFRAAAQGMGTTSGLLRRSHDASSATHRVFASAGTLDLVAVQSMPATVRTGQTSVIPFSLTIANPGGVDGASARIRRLQLRIEDPAGGDVIPAAVLQRVVVSEGNNVYLVRTAIETAGSDLALDLATPITVTPVEPVTVSVKLDLADTTTTPAFRVALVDTSAIVAEDAVGGGPVAVAATSYPLRSGVARFIAEAAALEVSAVAMPALRVARGSLDVGAMELSLQSPGIPGITTDVRVSALRVRLEDTTGTALRPSQWLARLQLKSGATPLGTRVIGAADSIDVPITLSPPLSVPASVTAPLELRADLLPGAPIGPFRVVLGLATTVDARDASSGQAVPVSYLQPPVAGRLLRVEAHAETLRAQSTPRLPVGVSAGRTGLVALEARLRHPHPAGTGRIQVDTVRIRCRNEARQLVSPATFLAAIEVRWGGAVAGRVTGVTSATSGVAIPVLAPSLEAGDSAHLEIVADLSPAAPPGWLELEVPGTGVIAEDLNRAAPIQVVAEDGFELPLLSGLTRILPVARDLSVALASTMPAALASDGAEVAVGSLRFGNEAGAGAGGIGVDGLLLRAADAGFASLAIGAAATEVAAYRNGTLWGVSAALTPDSSTALVVPVVSLDVQPGATEELELRIKTRTSAAPASVRVGLDAAGVILAQPNPALPVVARPAPGRAFPMWTETGNFSGTSLGASWSNFPNPFAAGREATTFAYWLRAPAQVTLRLWTPRNQIVRTLLAEEARATGLHQSDRWDGRNGAGEVVRNGVYLAEIAVRYDDGTTERLLRKVAVVR